MRVDLHPEARAELRSGALWYEERRDGLGEEFVAAVDAVFLRIGKAPKSFPRWAGTEKAPAVIRKAPVERFPYAGYQLDSNSIRVGGTRNKSVPSYRPIHRVGSVASYIQARVRGRARTESSNFGRSGSERPITASGLRDYTAQDGGRGRSHREWPIRSSSSRRGPVMPRAHSCRSIS